MTLKGNIGIHGTNRPDSVGHLVSHGCIRMREKDVEALFDLVHVGTPVEITYNRVVVEKAPDDTVVYYVYPDGYGWQKLRPEDVQKWLSGYGVGDFVSDSDIEAKIDASDGEPTFVAKVYPLYLNGIRLKKQAVVQDGITYLPANDLAEASGIDLGWNPESGMLISMLGKAKGYDKRDVLYCRAEDAAVLFHLDGVIDENKRFILTAKKQKEMMDTAAEEKRKRQSMVQIHMLPASRKPLLLSSKSRQMAVPAERHWIRSIRKQRNNQGIFFRTVRDRAQ